MDGPVRPRVAGHWPALDGLRGLAAATVVVVHGTAASVGGQAWLAAWSAHPLGVLVNSRLAVETFFVLSGFVLTGSLLRQASPAELPQFYVRRVFRIHPPYMAAVLFAWCASFFYGPLRDGVGLVATRLVEVHLAPGVLLSSLLLPGPAHFQLPGGWTLLVEIVFSFLLPGMLLMARRAHWSVLLALCTAPLVMGPGGVPVLKYALDFALGMTLFLERERLARWLEPAPALVAWTLVAAFLAVGGVPRYLRWERSLLEVGAPSAIALQALGAAGLTAAAAFAPAVRHALSRRPCVFLGRISYSLYLVHFPLVLLLARLCAHLPAALGERWLVPALFAVAVPVSALGYRFVERPAIGLGNRLCALLAQRAGVHAVISRLNAARR